MLALTANLMTTTLSRSECRYHLAAFSASTPFGALFSYGTLSFLGASLGEGDWTGIALLLSVSFQVFLFTYRGVAFKFDITGRILPLRRHGSTTCFWAIAFRQ